MRSVLLPLLLWGACTRAVPPTDNTDVGQDTDATSGTGPQEGTPPALTGPAKGNATIAPRDLPAMPAADAVVEVIDEAGDVEPSETQRYAPYVELADRYVRIRLDLRPNSASGLDLVRVPGDLRPQARVRGDIAAVVRDVSGGTVRWVTTVSDPREQRAYATDGTHGGQRVSGLAWIEVPADLLPPDSSTFSTVNIELYTLAPTAPRDLLVDVAAVDTLLADATRLGTLDPNALNILMGGKP